MYEIQSRITLYNVVDVIEAIRRICSRHQSYPDVIDDDEGVSASFQSPRSANINSNAAIASAYCVNRTNARPIFAINFNPPRTAVAGLPVPVPRAVRNPLVTAVPRDFINEFVGFCERENARPAVELPPPAAVRKPLRNNERDCNCRPYPLLLTE
ncbi:hypothetical protein DERP_007179 [Dermatophagoides pteronyssinus]|uniref:Uncharacterized protein n=1 Tax=Dermatophagoides pteronyssinus TaxID=6956 RepID=A0ABQ8JUI2_DERPT|nr:hypothetical protein DERP_007179 [Dermatophagoides pteronyssinus]